MPADWVTSRPKTYIDDHGTLTVYAHASSFVYAIASGRLTEPGALLLRDTIAQTLARVGYVNIVLDLSDLVEYDHEARMLLVRYATAKLDSLQSVYVLSHHRQVTQAVEIANTVLRDRVSIFDDRATLEKTVRSLRLFSTHGVSRTAPTAR